MHAFLAEAYGRSLSSMLVELAMMHLYGLPERHTTIVKRCDMKLDAVHPCTQLMSADRLSCGRMRSSHRPEVAAG